MKYNKQILATVFLVFFGIIQLADLHILSHDDDSGDTECETCDFISKQHHDDFVFTHITFTPKVITIPLNIIKISYRNLDHDIVSIYTFLNKAPPLA